MPCTTILVGKKASYDGSTLVARNEDSGAGAYSPKKFIVVKAEDQPKTYRSVISHVSIKLPDNPQRITLMPNAIDDEGIWGACGFNEARVFMTATETITSNERVLAADPLVVYKKAEGKEGEKNFVPEQIGGIGEEDLVSLVLPFIKSAREGVLRLGKLLEQYGTYEMNGIAFQDQDNIWWLETIGGHHWMARRLPDDCYAVIPNQLGLDAFDLDDAFGAKENFLCSDDLREFIEKNHLDLSLDGRLNPRDAFGSHSDSDHVYNTPRAWILQRYFNPNENIWDGEDADYRPDSDDIPWCRVPERKITVEDCKVAMSNHFQGTPYDPYGKHGDPLKRNAFRSIAVNRTNFLGLGQIRPYQPEAIRCLEWLAVGCNVFNAMIPFYANVNTTPAYLSQVGPEVTTENLYWNSRLIAALADAHYSDCSNLAERYQNRLQSRCLELIHKFDRQFVEEKISAADAPAFCEKANEEIAAEARKETALLLDKVLHAASNKMVNGFSRSDA